MVKETKNIPESPFEETTAEVPQSTGLRATALDDRSTNNPPRRLQRPSTGVPQLTTRLDDFNDENTGVPQPTKLLDDFGD